MQQKLILFIEADKFLLFAYTSGKNVIKITGVGMGAAKSSETREYVHRVRPILSTSYV